MKYINIWNMYKTMLRTQLILYSLCIWIICMVFLAGLLYQHMYLNCSWEVWSYEHCVGGLTVSSLMHPDVYEFCDIIVSLLFFITYRIQRVYLVEVNLRLAGRHWTSIIRPEILMWLQPVSMTAFYWFISAVVIWVQQNSCYLKFLVLDLGV